MKKRIPTLILFLVCALLLSGCFCSHEWADATCIAPKTCTKCEKTEGEALGHVWMAATCTEPKTCEVCSVTDGDPKGHSWVEATCTEAKHCEVCHLIEGEALGHLWLDATTEAPQTCQNCGQTEGDRIITDARFKTAAVSELLGKGRCQLDLNAEALGVAGFEGSMNFAYPLDFGNAGDLIMGFEIADEAAFMDALITISIEKMYAEFSSQGLSKEGADSAMKDTYGMGVEEYIRSSMEGVSINQILSTIYSSLGIGGVYYVEGDQLYFGLNWESNMEPSGYSLTDGVLVIDSLSESFGFEAHFSRVME